MAYAVNDLTWAQINDAIEANCIEVHPQLGVIIRPSLLTEDQYPNLQAQGVVEFLHKFLSACSAAQSAANSGQPPGSRLNSFPGAVATAPINNVVTVTHSVISRVPLNLSNITGSNS